jgi:hypothetical protein
MHQLHEPPELKMEAWRSRFCPVEKKQWKTQGNRNKSSNSRENSREMGAVSR